MSAANVWTDPVTIRHGDLVGLGADIFNQGSLAASAVPDTIEVRFYDGNPNSGGRQVGTSSFASVAPMEGAGAWTGKVWNTSGLAGRHDIYVVVDAANRVLEASELNNVVSTTVAILSSNVEDTAAPTGTVSISGTASAGSQDVTLTMSAQDDVEVKWMVVSEQQFSTAARRWITVASSGWISYGDLFLEAFSRQWHKVHSSQVCRRCWQRFRPACLGRNQLHPCQDSDCRRRVASLSAVVHCGRLGVRLRGPRQRRPGPICLGARQERAARLLQR